MDEGARKIVTDKGKAAVSADIFANGGEMGALMRSLDWSTTPIGSVENWSQSLRIALRICLQSRFPMVIWWGKDLVLLYNDAWKPVLGTKHPHALGQPGQQVWSEIWDVIGPQLEQVLSTGQATWSDDLLLLMDRYGYIEESYFTYSYSPIPDETGRVGGVFTAVTETTQRVLGERRVRTLRDLAAQAGQAKTAHVAGELAIQTLSENPADIPFALIYLLSTDEKQAILCGSTLSGADTSICKSEIDLTQTQSQVKNWSLTSVMQTGRAVLIENLQQQYGLLPSGLWTIHPQQAMILPLAAAGQERIAGMLVVGVNPCRVLDEDYRNFFEMTAGHIATTIANACAYEEERKRAEALAELDQAKTVFFSNVSHEFRTPLTLMLGPIEDILANQSEPFPSERQQIEIVHRNALRLLKLVNTLLDFSRIEAGRIQAVYEATDLAMLTIDLAGVFRSAIERAGLRLVVDCPPLPEPVYVDREMWEKIVLNLLSNAFKFTFEGEISVDLLFCGDCIKLEVRDTGTGIPASELPHLFERFHRVQGARGRSYEGSGIGLSLVQELVKLHSGTIQVTSVVGQGTSFIVSIPTGYAHLPSDRLNASRTLASTALGATPYVEEALRWLPQEDGETRREGDKGSAAVEFSVFPSPRVPLSSSPVRILLADDNADMRDYVKRLLSERYEVEVVEDGVAALAAVRRQTPDLILTDIMMPLLDGLGLLQQIRSNPNTRDIPIILLSARAGEESRIEGIKAGADDYIIKPFSARELLARIEANLKMQQMRQEANRKEQALRTEAEAAYLQIHKILGSITDAFLTLNNQWQFTHLNPEAERLMRRNKEILINKNVWEEFPELIDSIIYQEYHRSVAQQIPVQFEVFYERYDQWFEIRAYPFDDGLTVYFQDVTERKGVGVAFHQTLQKLNFHVENTPLAVVEWDYNFCITRWSSSAERIFGWKAEEVLGNHFTDWQFIFEDDQEQVADMCKQLVAGNKSCVISNNRNYRKDGSVVHCEWYNSNLTDASGKMNSVLSLVLDITERKKAEQEREQLLERERASREEAEAANRVKDEFLAILSHELRSPLNAILGWSKLLRTRKFDRATTDRALETIERNAQLQTQLIEDLLDVSRILRGKINLNICPVNLASVIEAAINTMRPAAEAKSVQVIPLIDSNGGIVSGDPNRLQQIVWNLLSNAIKFTSSGGQVQIKLETIKSYAQIIVSDTGQGISADFLPHVFEYFRQADPSTTRNYGGLGLGLAIVRHLVELHGGTVCAESLGEGFGSTFTVSLPLMKQQLVVKQQDEPLNNLVNLNGVKVLVVDDEIDTREFLVFALEQYGAKVISAASAQEALEFLVQFKPDVLVSDIGMPGEDGYSLLRYVRMQGVQIPAIALTAYAQEADRQKALSVGFQTHLSKPVDPAELATVVANLLGK